MLYPISSLVDSRWIFGAHVPVALARAFLICTFRGRLAIAQIFKIRITKNHYLLHHQWVFCHYQKKVGMILNFYIPFICPQTALVISRKLMISLCWRNAVFDPQTIFIYSLEQIHIEKCSNVFNERVDFSKYCIRHEISAKMIRTFRARAARAS